MMHFTRLHSPRELTYSGPPAHFPQKNLLLATLRPSCGCLKISDCLFLNPLLMRIKAKLNQSFIPSQGQPKHEEDQGTSSVIHRNLCKQTTRVLYIHKLCTFSSLCVDSVLIEEIQEYTHMCTHK